MKTETMAVRITHAEREMLTELMDAEGATSPSEMMRRLLRAAYTEHRKKARARPTVFARRQVRVGGLR